MKTTSDTVSVSLDVSIKDIQDTLCSAFEGGSNYWYRIEEFIKPTEFTHYSFGKPEEGKEPEIFRHIDYPTNPGGALIVSDYFGAEEDEEGMTKARLDLESIKKGITVMANLYPYHFKNMIAENGDAETGDVLLQCCVFGKLVYG